MATQFTYSVEDDTLNGIVALNNLTNTIRSSDITIALEGVTHSGDNLIVDFKDDISGAEETILDGIIAAHDGVKIVPEDEPIEAITIKTDVYTYEANAFTASCSNGSTVADFKIENYTGQSYTYKHISGGMIFIDDNTKYGMYADFQVIDKDNILGYGANVVLKQYIRKIYINPTCPAHFGTEPPGAIPVGLYLRANIYNPHAGAINAYINLDMYTKDES